MHKLALVVLFFTVSVYSQTPTPTPPKTDSAIPFFDNVYQEYDKFDDSTTLMLEFGIIPQKDALRMYLGASYNGTKPGISNLIILTMISTAFSANYSPSTTLIFLADDERLRLQNAKYTSKRIDLFSYGDRITEEVSFVITQDQLKKLAYSKKHEAKLGTNEFTIPSKGLLLLQEFYKKLI